MTGLMLLYFWFVEVGDEIAVVGHNSYSGYEAVQVNREITKDLVLGCVLVICGVSTVFAEEGQTKMLPFTTEEGKRKDIRAKVQASCTLGGFRKYKAKEA